MNFLKLIRVNNLIFIAFIQYFIKFGLFLPFGISTALTTLDFILLVISTLCIAAAGYIINDMYDVAIDNINQPEKVLIGTKISEKKATNLFIILNSIGIIIGFYLANKIEKPELAALFFISSALLYVYASYLKSTLIISNIIISVLVALSILIVGIFDLLPAITQENQATQSMIFRILIDYATFAFILNLIREIVKDVQDIDGDKNGGINTIPIAIGRKRTNILIFILGVIATLLVISYMYLYLYENQVLMLYFLFFIVGPLLYFCIKTWTSETKKDYAFLSTILKTIMFLGMCSILLFQFTIL